MCGIAGIVNIDGEEVSKETLLAMNHLLAHRGPDDAGIYTDGPVGLAHRRLAIIDIANGAQPMLCENNDTCIVFNGEIYNQTELRALLESKGDIFRTNCDTEVLLRLYKRYGAECVEKLNGMFAFAVYDKKNKKLFLARDRMGQKPLLYFISSGKLVFASEMSALKKHPNMPLTYNLQAIHDYFSLQYIPSPSTVYGGVYKLPPGHTLELDIASGKSKLTRYWKVDFSEKLVCSYSEAQESLRELLEDSVRKRLMSDVPYGVFLSGGMDSTIIAGIMSKLCDDPISAFTIGFKESKYDERSFANAAANAIGKFTKKELDHHQEIVSQDDFAVIEKLSAHYGEPYCDASMLPTYLLSSFTRKSVTVALSGDGADEIFAGYNRYLVMKFARYIDILPATFRRVLSGSLSRLLPPKTEERSVFGAIQRLLGVVGSHPEKRYLDIISRFSEGMKSKVYGDAFNVKDYQATRQIMRALYTITSADDYVEKIMEIDINTYLPGDILTKVDIASMATSLEVRSPFMDHRLVEFAASLPRRYKQTLFSRKHILKDAFSDMIPHELLARKKMGFGVPLASWFRGKWDSYLRERLLDGEAVKAGFFKQAALEEMIRNHQLLKGDYSYPLWSMLIFELFLNSDHTTPSK